MQCPCCSGKDFADCCQQYLQGDKFAPNPETLMRSRYSAFATRDIDYVANTMAKKAAVGFDKSDALMWATKVEWQKLQVVKAITKNPELGYVEFIAFYNEADQNTWMHELSEFHKIDGKWFYVDGKSIKPKANDKCLCGSGKKFKKCCGNKG